MLRANATRLVLNRRTSARVLARNPLNDGSFFFSNDTVTISKSLRSVSLASGLETAAITGSSSMRNRHLSSNDIHKIQLKLFYANRSFSAEASGDDLEDAATTSVRHVPHIRNVAIVAHVDHGKTTIVDELLRCASESGGEKGGALVMDCGDLERERGITITSKVTRLDYHQNGSDGVKTINVVDTVSSRFIHVNVLVIVVFIFRLLLSFFLDPPSLVMQILLVKLIEF